VPRPRRRLLIGLPLLTVLRVLAALPTLTKERSGPFPLDAPPVTPAKPLLFLAKQAGPNTARTPKDLSSPVPSRRRAA